jgi:hypothetical protein
MIFSASVKGHLALGYTEVRKGRNGHTGSAGGEDYFPSRPNPLHSDGTSSERADQRLPVSEGWNAKDQWNAA